MNFEREIDRLKDTLVVMAEIQRRQAEVQRQRAEGIALHDKQMAEIRLTLAEVGDKLNGLIDIVDGIEKKRPPDAPN